MELVSVQQPRAAERAGARAATAAAVSAFSADLFTAVAASGSDNLVCSGYSVAAALGMTVQGARGLTAEQILQVLHSPDAGSLAEGLNAIDLALASRSGDFPGPDPDKRQRVELSSANSLWGQGGMLWQQPFLQVLARQFGTGMRVVDYAQPEAARAAINAWVSQQTRTRIPELIPPNLLNQLTRLILVNALYFKAPWRTPFEPERTRSAPFHRLDGSSVDTPLMSGTGQRFASGPGWVGVDLPYVSGRLAMAVVVPDAGRFAEVQAGLTGDGLSRMLAGFGPASVRVGLPRWRMRTQIELRAVLSALGMPVAFTDRADFSAMTDREPLLIDKVVHEGFIAVDEAGTEAAAATAVVVRAVSAAVEEQTVVADRPFLYVIHDVPTGVPLFIGRVLDPTA